MINRPNKELNIMNRQNTVLIVLTHLIFALAMVCLVTALAVMNAPKANADEARLVTWSEPRFPNGVQPCPYEDGGTETRCVWDGRHMGDKKGRSLLIRGGGVDVGYKVITHRRAHRLIARWNNRPIPRCPLPTHEMPNKG